MCGLSPPLGSLSSMQTISQKIQWRQGEEVMTAFWIPVVLLVSVLAVVMPAAFSVSVAVR